jgi:hypothetical protein
MRSLPAASLVRKLVKPEAAVMSATLKPAAVRGVVREAAEAAFCAAAPSTAGSTRGMIPLRASVTGSVASLHSVGCVAANGLKFCSAATSPLAASSPPSPRVATISSAFLSCYDVSEVQVSQ